MPQQTKLGKGHTTVAMREGTTHVTYYNTIVCAFNDKRITLDNGGWVTASTRTRMNQASQQFGLGYHVHIANGAMIAVYNGKQHPFVGQVLTLARN